MRLYNQSPLKVITYDGSNSPYHPSVLYKAGGYDGYNYIMSETPFFISLPNDGNNYRDQFECPSIHFSNDGIHWAERIQNPIAKLNYRQIKNRDYYSDPDLVNTPTGLECWYRINRRYGDIHKQENISILRRTSENGFAWSEEEEIINLERDGEKTVLGKIVVCPAIIYEDGFYEMWYVDNNHTGKGRIRFAKINKELEEWKGGHEILLEGPQIFPWHIHVLKDLDVYWLTIYDRKSITIWKGNSTMEFCFVRTLLEPSYATGSFYSHRLYRACLTVIDSNKYRLYFSANDMFRTYIGVMEGSSPEDLSLISVDGQAFRDFKSFIKEYVITNYITSHNKISYYCKRIVGIVLKDKH